LLLLEMMVKMNIKLCNDGVDEAYGASPSAGNMDERISSKIPFERLVISHMCWV